MSSLGLVLSLLLVGLGWWLQRVEQKRDRELIKICTSEVWSRTA